MIKESENEIQTREKKKKEINSVESVDRYK